MDEDDSEPGGKTPVNCQNSLDLKYIKLYELNDTTFSTAKIKQHFQNFEEVILGTNLLLLLKSLQSCPTSCDPSPPGSPSPGILQARTLQWVAISFSNSCMHVQLCTTLWTELTRLLCPRDSLGKSTGVGGHFLLHLRI